MVLNMLKLSIDLEEKMSKLRNPVLLAEGEEDMDVQVAQVQTDSVANYRPTCHDF